MTGLNFQKLNRKRKLSRNGKAPHDDKASQDYAWQLVPFKKHEGKTLPEILFTDPRYIFWLVSKGTVAGKLGHQLKIVAARAKHVLPPRDRPADYQFGIQFNELGRPQTIAILAKSNRPAGLVFSPHLDLSIFCQFSRREWAFEQELLAWLTTECFGHPGPIDADADAAGAFVADDSNFALTCRELHGFPYRSLRKRAN